MNSEAIIGLILSGLTFISLILTVVFFLIPLNKKAKELNDKKMTEISKELTDCKLLRGDVTNEKFNELISEFGVEKNETENIANTLENLTKETHSNFLRIFKEVGEIKTSNATIMVQLVSLSKSIENMERKNGKNG